MPRIAGRAKHLHAAGSELDGVELAQTDGPGAPQPGGHGTILRGGVISHDLRRRSGGQALDIVNVLVGDWDTVQRTTIAARRDLDLGGARRLHGRLAVDVHIGPQVVVQLVNARQVGLDHLDRRDLTLTNQWHKIGNIGITQLRI